MNVWDAIKEFSAHIHRGDELDGYRDKPRAEWMRNEVPSELVPPMRDGISPEFKQWLRESDETAHADSDDEQADAWTG